MGGEKKPLVMSDLGCADGCGRQMGAENSADGCGRLRTGNGWGEGKGWERKGERKEKGRERKGKEGKGRERKGKEGKGRERMGKEGKGRERNGKGWVQRTAWVQMEMGGEKKPLVMSELGCADGCGRGMGAEKCADGCGWRECNGVAGNGWGEEAAGDERA